MFSNLSAKLDLLGYGHAVLGDDGGAEALLEHDVAALGTEGDAHGAGQGVDALEHCAPGVLTEVNLLAHG